MEETSALRLGELSLKFLMASLLALFLDRAVYLIATVSMCLLEKVPISSLSASLCDHPILSIFLL